MSSTHLGISGAQGYFAFGPEGLPLGHSFTANNSG